MLKESDITVGVRLTALLHSILQILVVQQTANQYSNDLFFFGKSKQFNENCCRLLKDSPIYIY